MKFHATVKVHPMCSACKKPIEGSIWIWQHRPFCGNCELVNPEPGNAIHRDEVMAREARRRADWRELVPSETVRRQINAMWPDR